jgi:hypothetical protein
VGTGTDRLVLVRLFLFPQIQKLLHRRWPMPSVVIIGERKKLPNLFVQNQVFQNIHPVLEIVFSINNCLVSHLGYFLNFMFDNALSEGQGGAISKNCS